MVAHLDAVTSLAVDPNGLYLLSGSKLVYSFIYLFIYSFIHCLSCHLRSLLRTIAFIEVILVHFILTAYDRL